MKIKGIAKNLSYKTLFACCGIAGALLTALRCWQALRLLDPETGFFTDKSNFTVLLFYVLSIGLVVAALVLFYLAGDRGPGGIAAGRSVPHAVGSLALAVTVGMDALQAFRTPGEGGGTDKLTLARGIFGALAALVLLLDFVVFLTGAGFGKKLRIVRLFPVVWAFFVTVGYFAVTASYLHSSQLLLVIFGNAFLMLFFFEYARKQAGVNAGDNTAVFCATGAVAAILLFACGMPALILRLTGGGEIAYCPFAWYHLAGALFCVTALCLRREDEKTVPTAPFPAPGQEEAAE